MIITAMYLYGVIQHAWSFSVWYMIPAFIMDIILAGALSANVRFVNKISDEEKLCFKEKADYFRKKWEVEELKRKMFDRRLH